MIETKWNVGSTAQPRHAPWFAYQAKFNSYRSLVAAYRDLLVFDIVIESRVVSARMILKMPAELSECRNTAVSRDREVRGLGSMYAGAACGRAPDPNLANGGLLAQPLQDPTASPL